MAKRRINPSIGDVTGKIGDLVYYNRNGKALVRRAPMREIPFQLGELTNQARFRMAQTFAKNALTDPSQRARYAKAAAGLDANAQNMAVSDFYHSPTIGEVDLTGYTGRAREFIRIRAEEGKIGAAGVNVRIDGRAAALVEEGTASVELDGVTWWYVSQKDIDPDQPLWITVTAIDQPGNRTTSVVRHISGG
jgi:hypothetical protein